MVSYISSNNIIHDDYLLLLGEIYVSFLTFRALNIFFLGHSTVFFCFVTLFVWDSGDLTFFYICIYFTIFIVRDYVSCRLFDLETVYLGQVIKNNQKKWRTFYVRNTTKINKVKIIGKTEYVKLKLLKQIKSRKNCVHGTGTVLALNAWENKRAKKWKRKCLGLAHVIYFIHYLQFIEPRIWKVKNAREVVAFLY